MRRGYRHRAGGSAPHSHERVRTDLASIEPTENLPVVFVTCHGETGSAHSTNTLGCVALPRAWPSNSKSGIARSGSF
jgi:hypothetical protein